MWTKEDEQFLYKNPTMSLQDIATHLNKSIDAVRSKRSRLGIAASVAGSPWTRDERILLTENYSRGKEYLLELFPNRTWDSIRSQASWLRKRQWNVPKNKP